MPEYGIVNPVDVISTVPVNATAQLALPGTDAVAVPVQLIVPLLPSVACAEPVPVICTLPLQMVLNVPATDVAVMLVIVHAKAPHEFCGSADSVDAYVPVLRLVEISDVVVTAVAGASVVIESLHAAVARRDTTAATVKNLMRMSQTLA